MSLHRMLNARSIAARSARQSTMVAPFTLLTLFTLFTRLDDVERPVRPLSELLDARLGVGQLVGCGAELFDAFLEECQSARQLQLAALELLRDCLESRQSCLEL